MVQVPGGVEFKVYPTGSANGYSLYDASTGVGCPAVSVEAPAVGQWQRGPFEFTTGFDCEVGETVHLLEGEVGFEDTEYGVSFYSVPRPFTR